MSHVGKIRSNNQDSGYAGMHLFVVADGMGGHAGGDVASAIAAKRIAEADAAYPSVRDAEFALQQALIAANSILAETVFEHSELTGMGTTVSGILRVGDQLALAHIGDSRVYRFRDGEFTQITADHTFVQRLVDSGRITPEEAAVHPRRSVLMRVLGDVDAAPEIDTAIFDTRPGDRWMLCSDGLSSYVADDKMSTILATVRTAQGAADRLVKESLDHGAPDNVTVVLVDIDDSDGSSGIPPTFVGSAAVPLSFESDASRRPIRLPTSAATRSSSKCRGILLQFRGSDQLLHRLRAFDADEFLGGAAVEAGEFVGVEVHAGEDGRLAAFDVVAVHDGGGAEFVGSAINLAAVPDAVDTHDANFISNLVNNPVVTNPDAPVVLAACQLAAAGRARVPGEGLNRRDDAVVNGGREAGEVFLGGAFE